MTTTYFYFVNGEEFETTEVFGPVWKAAKAYAAECHCPITRAVVKETRNGEEIRYEFYAKGGCFLDDRYYEPDRVAIL
jgi:hypothetical protein